VRDVLVQRGLPLTHTQTVELTGDRSLVVSTRRPPHASRDLFFHWKTTQRSRLIDSLIEFPLTLSLFRCCVCVCVRVCMCGFLAAARASSFAAWPQMRNLNKTRPT